MVATTAPCLPTVILEEAGPDEETHHITRLGMPQVHPAPPPPHPVSPEPGSPEETHTPYLIPMSLLKLL